MLITDDKELLKQIKKDPQAFTLLYDRHSIAIFSYVFRRLGNYDVAKDITAETFLKAYQKINSFVWRDIPISAWFYRIATNEINLYLRRRKYTPSCIESSGLQNFLKYEPGIESEKEALEKEAQEHREFIAIRERLKALDVKYGEVIALRFFEEKSIKEIAAILNKKEGTVKSLLSRGLEKLRETLKKTID